MTPLRFLRLCLAVSILVYCHSVPAQVTSHTPGQVLFLDFEDQPPSVKLLHGVRPVQGRFGSALEFTTALQYAELEFSRSLHEVKAVTVGGWLFPRRTGEQSFFFRGTPEIGPLGDRFFRPAGDWVNFVLGTDQRGFLLGTINGNGSMPFTRVTVNEVPFDAWNQLVVTKSETHHLLCQTSRLVHPRQRCLGHLAGHRLPPDFGLC